MYTIHIWVRYDIPYNKARQLDESSQVKIDCPNIETARIMWDLIHCSDYDKYRNLNKRP